MNSLISIQDLGRDDILSYLTLAASLKSAPKKDLLKDKIIALAFFEASTRTRLSFETAILRLGGKTIGFSDAAQTSTSKGESFADTLKVISSYSDALIIRHPFEGSARLASEIVTIPIINAGDGANQHPTQTLIDLFTMQEFFGELKGLHLALAGDLKYGRTVHSLVIAAALFDMRLYFVAEENLTPPAYLTENLKMQGVKFSFHKEVSEIMSKLDVLYLTRLQRERLKDEKIGVYGGIELELLKDAKNTLKIFHPLPRQDELPESIDTTPFAAYFDQVKNGVIVREAILAKLLGSIT